MDLSKWDTRNGLVAFAGSWLVTVLAALAVPGLKVSVLIIWPVAALVFVGLWWYKRSPYALLKKVNVIVALYSVSKSDEIQTSRESLKHVMRDKLSAYGIKPIFLPSDKHIASRAEAVEIIQAGYIGHTLMIWGDLTEFGGKVHCRATNFTYEFAYKHFGWNKDDVTGRFSIPIQKAISGYGWQQNLASERQFNSYVNSLEDVGLYVIARTLITVNEIKRCTEIVTEYLSQCDSLPPKQQADRQPTITSMSEVLSLIEAHNFVEAFLKQNKVRMKEAATIAYKRQSKSYNSNCMMAYVAERIDADDLSARKFVNGAEKAASKHDAAHLFSGAFLDLKEGKYTEALQKYGMAERKRGAIAQIPSVVEDLYRVEEESGDPRYSFALGLIKLKWLPGDDGAEFLRLFISSTEDAAHDYLVLRKWAQRYIDQQKVAA